MWILLAITSAFFDCLKDVVIKRNLSIVDPGTIALGMFLFAVPVLWIITLIHGEYHFNSLAVWPLLIGAAFETLAAVLYMRAIQSGELSLVAPLTAFTPLLLLLVAPVIVNEIPSVPGATGALLVVAGAYLLTIRFRRYGFFGPIKALLSDKGALSMLGAAACFAFTASFYKLGIAHASIPLYTACYLTITSGALFAVILFRGEGSKLNLLAIHYKGFIVIGLMFALVVISLVSAFSIGQVIYVMPVKRMQVLFSVLAGGFIFREKDIKIRIFAALLMLVGITLISLTTP